jgi:Single-stranded DNA-binding protein
MNNEINNSISLVGNVSSISDDLITASGKKYKSFDICKNTKYKNSNEEEVENKEYFTFRIFEDNLNKYDYLLEKGKWLHILGFIHSYTNDKNIRKTYFVVNSIRDFKKKNEKVEMFDYDWLNEDREI